MGLDIEAFAAEPEAPSDIVSIDVSEFFGEPENTTVFSFADPSAEQIFEAEPEGKKLRRMFPGFPQTLCATCVLLAFAHQGPKISIPPGIFYAQLAKNKKKFFLYLTGKFMEKFPHLKDMEEAIRERKNGSGTVLS